jgi:hypothetical protein
MSPEASFPARLVLSSFALVICLIFVFVFVCPDFLFLASRYRGSISSGVSLFSHLLEEMAHMLAYHHAVKWGLSREDISERVR